MRKKLLLACNLMCTDMGRALFSWKFLCSVLGVALLMLAALGKWLGVDYDVWRLGELALHGSGMESVILCVLPVFAFGVSYAEEWEQKAQRFWMVRVGLYGYAFSKLVVSFLSGVLVIMGGIGLFYGALSFFFPMYHLAFTGTPYEKLILLEGKVLQGFLMNMLHHGLTGGWVAVCGLWASTLLPNRFSTAAAPYLLNFALLLLENYIPPLKALGPDYWANAMDVRGTAGETLLVKLFTTLAICGFLSVFAVFNMRRRALRE